MYIYDHCRGFLKKSVYSVCYKGVWQGLVNKIKPHDSWERESERLLSNMLCFG